MNTIDFCLYFVYFYWEYFGANLCCTANKITSLNHMVFDTYLKVALWICEAQRAVYDNLWDCL